jgi:hypothetical protein
MDPAQAQLAERLEAEQPLILVVAEIATQLHKLQPPKTLCQLPLAFLAIPAFKLACLVWLRSLPGRMSTHP